MDKSTSQPCNRYDDRRRAQDSGKKELRSPVAKRDKSRHELASLTPLPPVTQDRGRFTSNCLKKTLEKRDERLRTCIAEDHRIEQERLNRSCSPIIAAKLRSLEIEFDEWAEMKVPGFVQEHFEPKRHVLAV